MDPPAGAPLGVSRNRSIAYRSEIDGLRALAVLPVIGFHAGIAGLSGGYLGVDIFFVISGYLITSLILVEREHGTFSLSGFWARRARRILPLLSVVVLACLPAAWWLLGWRDIEDFWQSLVAIGLFASNILFWREGTYFGLEAELKPLLHTWSLAVEEQFYILFPIACLAILRWGRMALFVVIAAVAAMSLLFFIPLHWTAQETAFFLLPTRAWQLLLGSLCAFASVQALTAAPTALQQVLAALGLILIGGAMALVATLGKHWITGLGLPALMATTGAALIVLFARPGMWVAWLLSQRPLVAIGLISYGAYLWHVPLLVFARHALAISADPELERMVELPTGLALVLCAVSLGLAAATWRWIEKPFRNPARVSARKAAIMGVGAGSILAGFAALVALTDWQQRAYLTHTLGAQPEAAREFLHHMRQNDFQPWTDITLAKGECVFASEGLSVTARERIANCHATRGRGVLVLGDSHAQGLHNIMTRLASEDAFIITIAKQGCRIDRFGCFYPEIADALNGSMATMFRQVLYTEAGSNRILDESGRADRQSSFINPSTARFDRRALGAVMQRLTSINAGLDTPLLVVGPHLEPRINFETAQPVLSGWLTRPTIRAQFEALDRIYREQAEGAGLGYTSMMISPITPDDRVLHDGCLYFFDFDHFSACGEERMGKALRASGHPIAQLAD